MPERGASRVALGFVDELVKIAKKKDRTTSPFLRGLIGGGLGLTAAAASAPFSYLASRLPPKAMPPKAAFTQLLLRMGERAAYGVPFGIAGGWALRNM